MNNEAIINFTKSLRIYKLFYDNNHIYIANVYNNLSNSYAALLKYE